MVRGLVERGDSHPIAPKALRSAAFPQPARSTILRAIHNTLLPACEPHARAFRFHDDGCRPPGLGRPASTNPHKSHSVAPERRRFGYRRLHVLLRREGHVINHQWLFRVYPEEKPALRRRGGRKRVAGHESTADGTNHAQ